MTTPETPEMQGASVMNIGEEEPPAPARKLLCLSACHFQRKRFICRLICLVAGIILGVILFWLTPGRAHRIPPIILRIKRWTHDNSHLTEMTQDHIHPWMNNAWYRYLYNTIEEKECYVCSHMPSTSVYPTIYGRMMDSHWQSECAASFASIGRQHFTISMKASLPGAKGLKNGTCDDKFWVDMTVKNRNASVPFPVFMTHTEKWHPLCFYQATGQGRHPLGHTSNCNATYGGVGYGTVNLNQQVNGTYWVQGMAWLCGQHAYFLLPPNWSGCCAPIFISDHTFKITVYNKTRVRRDVEVKPHDAILGTDVPENFKLWNTGEKVIHALFPWTGVGKHALRIETLDYRFGLFLNASARIDKSQNEEIDAIRITVMQHRVALDIVLAEKGGLCVLFNKTCCTYIPDNIHSVNMTNALNVLKQLRDAQQQDYETDEQGWWDWLLSGSWKSLLIKGLLALCTMMLLFCIFVACIIPCLRRMVMSMFNRTLGNYVLIQRNMEDPHRQYDMLNMEDREENPYYSLHRAAI
ncbi:uncharacterized protein LOC120729346 isoform X1 [Simochromis diagramma]|uniref:uncharacterized protein LOC120729346 isoform X1 n=1 Tax=Simochromis diagramma TaxID=43689 RepID=UPI001A7E97E1|nr:uncharacterized protein LOC120729346 isoform X1 [Simochromis diagramma]